MPINLKKIFKKNSLYSIFKSSYSFSYLWLFSHEICYLWGSTEQQASWMRHRRRFIISMMLPRDGPLAVVHALLRPLQGVSDNGPQRTAPGHVCVREQRGGAQLTPRLPRQQIVSRSRQDDCARWCPRGLAIALRGLAGPLGGGGRWWGGGRWGTGVEGWRSLGGFRGVGRERGSQWVALLLNSECWCAHVYGDHAFRLRGGSGGFLERVCNIRWADTIIHQRAWGKYERHTRTCMWLTSAHMFGGFFFFLSLD